MRTSSVVDDDLVLEATRLTGIKTRRALVREALATLIESRLRGSLLPLEGKLKLAPGNAHKKLLESSRPFGRQRADHRARTHAEREIHRQRGRFVERSHEARKVNSEPRGLTPREGLGLTSR